MNLFATLDGAMRVGEELQLRITKSKDGCTVLVVPSLGDEPERATDEVKQVRGALAQPLRLRMPADELDTQFAALLQGYAQARQQVSSSYEQLLDTLREAEKTARAGTKSKSAKAPGSVSKPTQKTEAPSARQSDAEAMHAPATPPDGSLL